MEKELGIIDKRKVISAILVGVIVFTGLVSSLGLRPRAPGENRPPAASRDTAQTGQLQVKPASIESSNTPEPNPPEQQMRETRALWVSRWDFKEHPDVQAIVDKAAEAHMNVIFFQVRGQADALYPSPLEPWSADLTGTFGKDPGWDPLSDLVTAAHAKGIEVHAWVNVFPVWMGSTPPPASATPTPMYQDFNARYGDDWLEWKGDQPMRLGQQDGYLTANPAHPAVADHIVAVCKDILSRYPVDGLHLDYIRYADPELSQDPVSNQAYAAAVAQNPGLSRADWQRAQVTHLVQRVRDEALPARPGARLTTTAWPVYQDHWGWFRGRDGYGSFYQDSQSWARDGLVSAITPMLYGGTINGHLDRFEALTNDYVSGSKPGNVVAGISADYESFSDIAAQIDVARKAGAKGEAIFSYRALDQHNYWSALGSGPYQQAATPNWG